MQPAHPSRNAALLVGLGLVGWKVVRHLTRDRLDHPVVLITGSSRGLGLAMAQEFARRGARLVLCARNGKELEWARQSVSVIGAEVLAVTCDLAEPAEIQQLIDSAVAHYGKIDILVNNAGIITVGPIENQTLADFEQSMDVMFWGTVRTTLATLPSMLDRGEGCIVNITSIGGKVSVPHLIPYGAAKFAAVGFSEGLHTEVAGRGVHVLTVVPGLMRTGSHVNAFFKGRHREEFAWFSLGASLPFTSMSAGRAAKQIIEAIERGDSEIILSPQAQLLARVHGLLPGFTGKVLSGVNRLLPEPGGIGDERRLGRESESPISESFLTALGRQAAETWHQYPRSSTQNADVKAAERP